MTSQPAAEPIVASFRDTPCDTGLDLGKLAEISDYFAEIRKKYQSFEIGHPPRRRARAAVPGAGRDAVQSGQPAAPAGRRRPL